MVEPKKSISKNRNDLVVLSQENPQKLPKKNCEECKAHEEYIRVLKNALKEVLDQNEALRARVAELEALISQSEDELEEKNQLMEQLRSTLSELELQDNKKKAITEEINKAEENQ